MSDRNMPESQDFTAIVEDSPMAVYVNALDSWELLYLNRLAKEKMSRGPGTKCYEIMGFDRPCPYCRVKQMSRDKLLTRTFYNPLEKRTYRMSGKLIDWKGQPAHIEYIEDITEKILTEQADKAFIGELQSVLQNIPGGICVYMFDGKKITPIFHNDVFYEIFGYSDEHILQTQTETANLNVHPDDQEELNRKIFEAIRNESTTHHVYRIYNDKLGEYRWIRLDGSVRRQSNGSSLLYGVYTDVNEQHRLEERLAYESERTQSIINAIPGGVAIYRVSDKFETVYFSDGVPALTGYDAKEYRELTRGDALELAFQEDRRAVLEKAKEAIRTREVVELEFRKRHRDGGIIWVRVQANVIGEDRGAPLLQCVFHNFTALKEAQRQLDHIINAVPGGIAIFRAEDDRLVTTYCSDGFLGLSGFSREEYGALFAKDATEMVFEHDRDRVRAEAKNALAKSDTLHLSFRIVNKNENPIWVHLSGKRMDEQSDRIEIYALITGASAETRLYQQIANESTDGIYVVDRRNDELLYLNTSLQFGQNREPYPIGKKCYAALCGKTEPCSFCTLGIHPADGIAHEVRIGDKTYMTRIFESDWNGIPAYIKYVDDVSDTARTRREKERLEEYFQMVLKNLPGGVAVVSFDREKQKLVPEYLSEGFASMCGMTLEEAYALYKEDACSGMHPDDIQTVAARLMKTLENKISERRETIYRLRCKDGHYIWVKNTSSLIFSEEGPKIYAAYSDMTKEIEERERMQELYHDMLFQHHQKQDSDLIIATHSDITEDKVIKVTDKTGKSLTAPFGEARSAVTEGLAGFIVDPEERTRFLADFGNEALKAAFQSGVEKLERDLFLRLPDDRAGRYVHIVMRLIESPDNGHLVTVLSAVDCTERHITEEILHRLSHANYDFIADIDLFCDTYKLLYYDKTAACIPAASGIFSKSVQGLSERVVPKDRDDYLAKLDKNYIEAQLREKSNYTFHFSTMDGEQLLTKSIIAFFIDEKLDRVCLACTDITESVREQRQLLKILAHNFDLACFIDLSTKSFTMHTRETVLGNLPPYFFEDYDTAAAKTAGIYRAENGELNDSFRLSDLERKLKEKPQGYDYTFQYDENGKTLYKQVYVLWGDDSHRSISMVRADVTEVVTEERKTREHLKNALSLAQDASQAKTDFLSAMSHDIRTPMNAIIGMTDLALADRDNPSQIDESLSVIKSSSEHLLHLINNILDMSRIESGKMVLQEEPVNIKKELEKTMVRMAALAEKKKLAFRHSISIRHENCLLDLMRTQQVLDNLIGNAIKFTPEGGTISLNVEELPDKNPSIGWYRMTVSDNGIGMDEETLKCLFEPFYRASTEETKRIEGTGLGLSIVKSILDNKGGTIRVESALGKGSRFIVEIPMYFADGSETKVNQKPISEANREEKLRDLNVLLVEDHPVNQLVARKLLEMFGAKVTLAENGEEAVKTFERDGPFDLVFMDVKMPVMDGYEATAAIRAIEGKDAETVPIVAMTANAFAGDIQRCLESGMDAHVSKPIDPDTLLGVVNAVLSRVKK